MGNPTTYRGYTMTWRGKQLVSASNGTNSLTFEYNEDGLRQKKICNNITTDYYYNGSVLIGMQRGQTKYLFSYDAAGNVVSVKQGDNEYYYVRNAQGDIVKLIDSTGAVKVEYTYDTWGKKVQTTGTLAGTLGLLQPFRYRGYVYDWETGLYYLESRYYDPTTGRFISADILLSTGQGVMGHNCYAYCNDNPVNLQDILGSRPDLNVNLTDGGGSRETYSYGAITLTITSSTITISANICFTGDLSVDTSQLIDGIKQYWNGKYDIDGRTYYLRVQINEVNNSCIDCITVYKYDKGGTSNTASIDDWSSNKSRKVEIFTKWNDNDTNYKDYAWTAAHEFGHCLGVKDFYNISAERKALYGDEFKSIFNDRDTEAQSADVKMVLNAFRTNNYQEW